MANQDPKFFRVPALQQFFVNKDTGLPLSGGAVYFYRDVDRTTPAGLKSVYEKTGTPGNYVFTALPNPLILSANGTYEYLNKDIPIYYNPFDANGNLDLYYIEVYESAPTTNLQYTYEGIGDTKEQEEEGEVTINYAPNGQYWDHNDLLADDTVSPALEAGEIRAPVTEIARGGYYFTRAATTPARDFVEFIYEPSPATNPAANPRYVLRMSSDGAGVGQTVKDWSMRFRDVNKFASTTQTFQFEATNNAAGSVSVELYIKKNFGTGGAPSGNSEGQLTTFSIIPGYASYRFAIPFGDNLGKIIGSNNDDYVEIALRAPLSTAYDFSMTNNLLSPGNLPEPIFRYQTGREALEQSLGGGFPLPNPDGSELYLKPRLTKDGWEFDTSDIGTFAPYAGIIDPPSFPLPIGKLKTNGDGYVTNAKSSDGIPYSRLQKKLFNPTLGYPVFGTGPKFLLTEKHTTKTNTIRLYNNTKGAVTAVVDGAAPTGFTFNTTHIGADYHVQPFYESTADEIRVQNIFGGPNTIGPGPGTSGFTFTGWQGNIAYSGQVLKNTKYSFLLKIVLPPSLATLAGKYWAFFAPPTEGGLQVEYVMWFQVDNAGAPPAVAGTLILVKLYTGDILEDVRQKIFTALAGFETTEIDTIAATNLNDKYFDADTTTLQYRIWYNVANGGTAPAGAGKILIEVPITAATDTPAEVATATRSILNNYSFSVPDLDGLFIRAFDDKGLFDDIVDQRLSTLPGQAGKVVGSIQMPQTWNTDEDGSDGTIIQSGDPTTPNHDSFWTRPWNRAFYWLINY